MPSSPCLFLRLCGVLCVPVCFYMVCHCTSDSRPCMQTAASCEGTLFYFLFFSSRSRFQRLRHECGSSFLLNSDAELFLPSLWKETNRKQLQSGLNRTDADRFSCYSSFIFCKHNSDVGSTSLNLQLFLKKTHSLNRFVAVMLQIPIAFEFRSCPQCVLSFLDF